MIVTENTFQPGHTLAADVCIVGSGPAAISLALRLDGTPLRVVMLAGGGWAETVASQDLYRGSVWPAGSHEPLEENRRRQFGGTSAAWGGRCIPFEPLDFKARAWVPGSGWPFAYSDLLPYYHQAAELCQIGDFEFDAQKAFPGSHPEILAGLDSEELVSYPLERWSPPVHFGKAYRGALEKSANIQVLLDAHVLALHAPAGSATVSHAEVSLHGQALTVAAGRFVLATGGIENARLLLASANDQFPAGLGNQHDNVGRYYMVHFSGTYADVKLRDKTQLRADFERDPGGVYCRRRWWFPEPTQAAHRMLNHVFFLYHANTDNGHRDVLFSSRFVAKSVLSILSQRSVAQTAHQARLLLPGLREHAANIVKNGLWEVPDLVRLGLKRMAKRRLPFLMPSKQNAYWGLYFQAEQAPNRESRVVLSATEKDAFGVPRAEVKLAFLEADLESIVTAHTLFVDRFRAQNLGDITYDEDELRRYLHKRIAAYNSASHHIGTTRMSEDPRTGVVDENAKVHGVSNLYVAGSSVFPTGGHANPTLTIVAHALLLADYLKAQPAA
ncbi:GMC oxidoreductase [Hymenobacter caeli]|uniref:Choline dehydrogenase-like flavoprotein n=1 Tax=Hymenobacter caeli TaxID=2735894 RepID=A0ABX2FQM3_9BACT|nr:GMC family oxidoreductase [Hymenobacter caeli]NRT18737.1 choline dehydrogenase-like flavoprotein [Hymenobacter caeli]